MKTNSRSRQQHYRPLMWAVIACYLFSMLGVPASVSAQDATEPPETPNVVAPGTGEENEPAQDEPAQDEPAEDSASPEATEAVEETPEDEAPPAASDFTFSATDPGNPAVIAHGLVYLSGDQSVWQVRELTPPSSVNAAESESAGASLVYQVEGSTIIRNDVTGKRALLEPGEAYFKAGGDSYTTFSNGGGSKIWLFEVVPTNSVSDEAFYESPMIDDYDEGVYDNVLVRYVLEPGESMEIPAHTGPALVMSTGGDVDIESGGLGLLSTGDGQLITEPGTIANNSDEPVQFVLAAFGEAVSDDTADSSGDATAEAQPSDDGDGTATEESTDGESTEGEGEDPAVGGDQTTLNITASEDIWVVVVADGTTVFDGPIPAGGQSGEIAGTEFTVYTSNAGATLFTNGCGEDFYMGYDAGEAEWTMTAEPCS